MAIYTVMAPRVPAAGERGAIDPMAVAFVKEGFSWPAFFFAEIWLVVSRMWLVLVLYVVVFAALAYLGDWIGAALAGAALVLGHFLFALEGNQLKRWTLARRGYQVVDIVEGRREEEAEVRFFQRAGDRVATGSAPPAPPAPPRAPPAPPSEIVGLFPAPAGGAPS
jgi:hypothetical protein